MLTTNLLRSQQGMRTTCAKANKIANLLSSAMTQCRRLQACQNLSLLASIKDKLFELIGGPSTQLADITDLGRLLLSQEKDDDTFGEEHRHVRDKEVDHQCQLLAFFLDKAGGKNLWNNWLDNSANPMSS
jgi:hypothetical protein